MEFIKKNLLAIIVAGAGVLALILGIALEPVAELGEEVKFFDLVFGFNQKQVIPGVGTLTMTGGLSITALVSFVALVAGIALSVISMFKNEKLAFIGAICIAVSGVLMLLALVVGTEVTQAMGANSMSIKFSDLYEGYKLGIGTIIYAIIAILGGAFGILNKFKKIV